MSIAATTRTLEQLDVGRHVCSVFDSDADRDAGFAAFFAAGCQRDEKLLFLSDGTPGESVLAALDGRGCAASELARSGRWRALEASEVYLAGAPFRPDRMIGLMQEEVERAVAEGYSALRVIGEMSWALRSEARPEVLLDYEVRLNRFAGGVPWIGLCAYDIRRFPPDLLLEVIDAHPEVALGTAIYPNDFYFPAEEYRATDRPAATLRFRLESLVQRAHDLKALSESEETLADALGALADAVVVFDDRLAYAYWNPAAERLFLPTEGATRPEHLLPGPGDGLSDGALQRARSGEEVTRTGVRRRAADGSELLVDECWTPRPRRSSHGHGVVYVARPAAPSPQTNQH